MLDDAGLPFWCVFAACLGKFGGHADPWLDHERYAEAVAVCEGCPVRERCLEYALTIHPQDDAGVWGGTTPLERVRLRKAARAA